MRLHSRGFWGSRYTGGMSEVTGGLSDPLPHQPEQRTPEQELWDTLNDAQQQQVVVELNKVISASAPRLDPFLVNEYLHNISAAKYPDREDLRQQYREIIARVRA